MLALAEASRPVFLILMGLSLLLIAWRLTRRQSGWPAWLMMAGAILLAFGYSVVLPLYTAGMITPLNHLPYRPEANPAVALGWHISKIFAMNGGWLFFGLGLALYARVFEPKQSASRVRQAETTVEPIHS